MPHATASHMHLPYRHLRVLDASQGLAGPYCAMLLAQHGAQVIKLEPPEGDWSRGLGKRYGDQTAIALAANRGKRSLALDMKKPGATEVVQRIARRCDVVIESFRPGVAQRLGLGYETLAAANPGLVYASVSGYGQHGPYAQRPGTDMVIQSFSGIMSLNQDANGKPGRVGFLVVDTLTGLYAYQAVAAALYGRQGGDGGRRLDISLMQASAAFVSPKLIEAALEGGQPGLVNPPAGTYRTADGWLTVAMAKEEHYTSLCQALNRPDLREDPRYATFLTRGEHLGELADAIAREFLREGTAHWVDAIGRAGGLVNPVNSLQAWFDDEHVQSTGAVQHVTLPGVGQVPFARIPGVSPPDADETRGRWPGIGEHGTEVLRDYGFDDGEITRLGQAAVLVQSPR